MNVFLCDLRTSNESMFCMDEWAVKGVDKE